MAEMTRPVQNNDDEIDLIHVLERISRFISSYKKQFVISALTGMLCGLAIYLIQPKSFGSVLILHSQILTNSEEIEIIENWNNLLKNGEYNILGKNLNCNALILKKVKRISAANILNSQPSNAFTVEVSVKDAAILDDLQKAIIFGLENNDYVKERVNVKRYNTVKLIENINEEIAKLDSTKMKIESGNGRMAPHPNSFIVDISGANVQMVTLKEKLYMYQESLKFVDAIQVLQNFEKYIKPASPRLPILIISGFLGGLFIGFAQAILKKLRSKIAILRDPLYKQFPNNEPI
jgi:hypothetical protein